MEFMLVKSLIVAKFITFDDKASEVKKSYNCFLLAKKKLVMITLDLVKLGFK